MPEVRKGHYRLLVVDDSSPIRNGLQDLFEQNGFDVFTAADGEEGLKVLHSEPAWDLVLLDLQMPKIDGFEVLKEMRRLGIQAPVVMLTVAGDRNSVLSGFDLGVSDYITKPFNPDVLLARVQAILRRRGHTPGKVGHQGGGQKARGTGM